MFSRLSSPPLRPLLLAILLALLYLWKYWPYPNIPSPIYGGDYWHQLSYLYHVMDGGSPFESSAIAGEVAGYMPIYPLLATLPFSLFHSFMDVVHAFLSTAIVMALIAYAILFLVFSRYTRDGDVLAFSLLLLLAPVPVFKYTEFASLAIAPLALHALLSFTRSPSRSSALLLGLSAGLLALSHVVGFLSFTAFSALYLLYTFRLQLPWRELAIAAIVALPLALLYWWKPLLVYHLSFAYDRLHMDLEDLGDPYIALVVAWKVLTSFLSPKGLLLMLALPALRKDPWPFLIAIAITFSYFLTEPLMGMNLSPHYVSSLLVVPLLMLYAARSFDVLPSYAKALLPLLAIGNAVLYQPPFASSPLPSYLLESAQWLRRHSSVYDVVLSTKELSFAINALTGRKVVAFRWAHLNNPYVRVWQRDRDAAIMLYGHDANLTRELLSRYNVSFLYWDRAWMGLDWQSDGSALVPMDPFMVFPYPEDLALLDRAGVPYSITTFWLDPSQRGPLIRRFQVAIISPYVYRSPEEPWSPTLDAFLEKAFTSSDGGAALYRVR